MRNKGKRSYKKEVIEDDYPLLSTLMPILEEFKPSTLMDDVVAKDSLKVLRALLNGEITKNDYCLWLLELEKKHPNIKPLSFKRACELLQKKKRFEIYEEYKGVKSI